MFDHLTPSELRLVNDAIDHAATETRRRFIEGRGNIHTIEMCECGRVPARLCVCMDFDPRDWADGDAA